MKRLLVAIGLAMLGQVQAHGPSNGGPDDPDASARPLRFDGDLARFRPLDERPLPWTTMFDGKGAYAASAASKGPASRR